MSKKSVYFECIDKSWFDDYGRLLELVDDKTLSKMEVKAVYAGAQVLRKGAQKQLQNRLPNANRRNKKYTDTLMAGVLISAKKINGVEAYSKVHIMGTREKGSGTFRLRFFEVGTTRTRKDGSKYGIKASKYNFFKSSTEANKTKASQAIRSSLIKQVNKIYES